MFAIGETLVLVYGVGDALPGTRCTIVDGPTMFPLLYQDLLMSTSSPEEFIAIVWFKSDTTYLGADDGFYHRDRFEKECTIIIESSATIKDNQGRSNCFKCGEETKKIQGFNSIYDVCPKCKV